MWKWRITALLIIRYYILVADFHPRKVPREGEIHVHSRHRDMPAPNLETVIVFGIVAIPTQLVVIPFLNPFLVKTHAHRTDSLAQRRFFLFIYF